MRTPPARSAWLPAVLGLALAAVSKADDDRLQTPIVVQEWSIWVGSPAQATVNTARGYRNAMPGVVGTSRPKLDDGQGDGRFPIAPVSVVQFFGEPTADIDIELRVRSGSLLAHWPPSRERAGGLRWFGADLVASPPADLPPAYLPEAHGFQKLREAEAALFLSKDASVERFIAYDAELAIPIPLKLRGGPDEYTLQNLSRRRLRDVAVIAPSGDGYRVGWLDELPAAVPEDGRRSGEEPDEEKEDPRTDRERAEAIFDTANEPDLNDEDDLPPLPAEGDATIRARVDQVLNRPVTLDVDQAPLVEVLDLLAGQARLRYELDDGAMAQAQIDPSQPTTLRGSGLAARDALAEALGNAGLSYRVTETGSLFITTSERLAEDAGRDGTVPEGPSIRLTLSQPLPASDPSYKELTRDAYARRLIDQGLREDSTRAILDSLGTDLFEPDGLIVLAHLSPEAIDDAVLLDVFPPPRQTVRVALLVVHGIDPRLQDHARALVEQLGDPSPEVRESAEVRLFELGPVAVPALEDALISQDLEIVFRAERLLLQLNRPVP